MIRYNLGRIKAGIAINLSSLVLLLNAGCSNIRTYITPLPNPDNYVENIGAPRTHFQISFSREERLAELEKDDAEYHARKEAEYRAGRR